MQPKYACMQTLKHTHTHTPFRQISELEWVDCSVFLNTKLTNQSNKLIDWLHWQIDG